MLDVNKDSITLLKVALKGTDAALEQAYRRSIVMLAKTEMDYGPESQPGDLEFRWESIDGYRVLTVLTDGSAFTEDFSDIPGIDECIWLLYDDNAGIADTNDANGVVLSNRDKFNIPDNEEFIIHTH